MSFGLGPKRASNNAGPAVADMDIVEGSYGVTDVMATGLAARKVKGVQGHPLELSEKNYQLNKLNTEMNMLRNTQGLHAPLKMSMELKAAKKIGRLPFLPSSNLMVDTLLGRDDQISFEDYLNPIEFREEMGIPHGVVEKSLGML